MTPTALTIAALFGLGTYAAAYLILGTVRMAVRWAIRARRWHLSELDPESVRAMAARIRAQLECDANRPAVTQDAWRDIEKEKRISWGRAR